MAHSNADALLPFKAASAAAQWVPVIGLEKSSSIDETVIPAGSYNQFPIGMTVATIASPGDPCGLPRIGTKAKGIAGASLGAFTPVGVGSTNGILIPLARGVVASTVTYQVGYSIQAAAPGDVFTIVVNPAEVV